MARTAVSPPTVRSTHLQGMACAILGAIAFSGKAILAKLMYRLGADPFAVVGLRMAMSFPLFLTMLWWSGRRDTTVSVLSLTKRQWWQVIGLGFSGYYLASTLDFIGLQYISASLERAILYLNPTVVVVLSALLLGKRIRRAQALAMVISYAGVVIVFLHDWRLAALVSQASPGLTPMTAIAVGGVSVFLSAVAYAVYLMGSGQMVQQWGAMRLVGLASCVACVMALLQWWGVWWWTHGQTASVSRLPAMVWLYSALNATACTVLPVWLVMRGVQLLGAATAAQAGMIGPLSTIWMASWFLGEPVTARLLLGTGTVLAGVLILARSQAVPPSRAQTSSSRARA